MRSSPLVALCLALLSACKTEPNDPGNDEPPDPVAEEQFAATAAETLCAQLFACQCGDNPITDETESLPWSSEAECVAEKQLEFQAMLDSVLDVGATYSPTCGGRMIADFERTDCQSAWAYLAGGGQFYDPQTCPLGNRERAVGDICNPYGPAQVNDCGEGKLCTYDETCIEVGELPVPGGEVCEVGGYDLPCAEGFYCNFADEINVCQPPAKIGDPCDYYCLGGDLTCDYESMTCVANAGEGESCEANSCAAGLYCDGGQEFTCVAQYPYGHGCANDSVCADGGRCINNICTPPAAAVCGWL